MSSVLKIFATTTIEFGIQNGKWLHHKSTFVYFGHLQSLHTFTRRERGPLLVRNDSTHHQDIEKYYFACEVVLEQKFCDSTAFNFIGYVTY